MTAVKMIAVGKKLANIYAELSQPICRKYGINQSCFDVLMFCANNPQHNTARDICAVRGITYGDAGSCRAGMSLSSSGSVRSAFPG